MPVTDLYIVGYLLEATRGTHDPLNWHADGGGGYSTQINGVRIELFHAQAMGWSGHMLRFTRGENNIHIEEPRPFSIFGRKYRNEDDRRLAETIQELGAAVLHQCHTRRARAWRLRDSIRESMYRRVLFGEPENV